MLESKLARKLEQMSAVTIVAKPSLRDWIDKVAHHHPLKWPAHRIAESDEPIVWVMRSTGSYTSNEELEAYLRSLKTGIMEAEFRSYSIPEQFWPKVSAESFDTFYEFLVFDHITSVDSLHQQS